MSARHPIPALSISTTTSLSRARRLPPGRPSPEWTCAPAGGADFGCSHAPVTLAPGDFREVTLRIAAPPPTPGPHPCAQLRLDRLGRAPRDYNPGNEYDCAVDLALPARLSRRQCRCSMSRRSRSPTCVDGAGPGGGWLCYFEVLRDQYRRRTLLSVRSSFSDAPTWSSSRRWSQASSRRHGPARRAWEYPAADLHASGGSRRPPAGRNSVSLSVDFEPAGGRSGAQCAGELRDRRLRPQRRRHRRGPHELRLRDLLSMPVRRTAREIWRWPRAVDMWGLTRCFPGFPCPFDFVRIQNLSDQPYHGPVDVTDTPDPGVGPLHLVSGPPGCVCVPAGGNYTLQLSGRHTAAGGILYLVHDFTDPAGLSRTVVQELRQRSAGAVENISRSTTRTAPPPSCRSPDLRPFGGTECKRGADCTLDLGIKNGGLLALRRQCRRARHAVAGRADRQHHASDTRRDLLHHRGRHL